MNRYSRTNRFWQSVASAVAIMLIASCNSKTVQATETVSKNNNGDVLVESTFNIGETGPGGGVVFAVSNNGANGLEFAPEVLSGDHISWGCSKVDLDDIPNLTGFFDPVVQLKPNEEVQSGNLNSKALAKDAQQACSSPAAQAAMSYTTTPRGDEAADAKEFTDWYLPSIEELLQIARLKFEVPLVSNEFNELITPSLWSSTEHTNEIAWFLLPDGSASIGHKDLSAIAVLPVRSF